MTDLQDLRARVRETRYEPERKSGLPFWLVTAAAVGIGFAVVMFAPRFFGGQHTALVTHTETSAPAPAAAAPAARRGALPPRAPRRLRSLPMRSAPSAPAATCLRH